MLFWSVFFKTQKKLLIAKNGQNSIFDGQYLFYVRFQKYRQKNICASIVLKLNQSQNMKKEKMFWGFLFRNQKHAFQGSKIVVF